jgi:hypothetical protein
MHLKHVLISHLVVILASILATGGLLRLAQLSERAKPALAREWPGDATLTELLVAAASLGVAFAGPFVLVTQWLIPRRVSPLTLGERLWIAPLTLYITAVVATRAGSLMSDRAAMDIAIGCGLLQWVASSLSVVAFFVARPGAKWSDRLGCLACLIAGLFLAYLVSAHPVNL